MNELVQIRKVRSTVGALYLGVAVLCTLISLLVFLVGRLLLTVVLLGLADSERSLYIFLKPVCSMLSPAFNLLSSTL